MPYIEVEIPQEFAGLFNSEQECADAIRRRALAGSDRIVRCSVDIGRIGAAACAAARAEAGVCAGGEPGPIGGGEGPAGEAAAPDSRTGGWWAALRRWVGV